MKGLNETGDSLWSKHAIPNYSEIFFCFTFCFETYYEISFCFQLRCLWALDHAGPSRIGRSLGSVPKEPEIQGARDGG